MSQQAIVRTPAETYQLFQTYLTTGRFEKLGDVVDFQNYTENCVGITGWTTGFDVALKNWMSGFGAAIGEMRFKTENIVQDKEMAVIRQHVDAKHVGTFLGIPATGRPVSFDMIDMLRVKEGRIV